MYVHIHQNPQLGQLQETVTPFISDTEQQEGKLNTPVDPLTTQDFWIPETVGVKISVMQPTLDVLRGFSELTFMFHALNRLKALKTLHMLQASDMLKALDALKASDLLDAVDVLEALVRIGDSSIVH